MLKEKKGEKKKEKEDLPFFPSGAFRYWNLKVSVNRKGHLWRWMKQRLDALDDYPDEYLMPSSQVPRSFYLRDICLAALLPDLFACVRECNGIHQRLHSISKMDSGYAGCLNSVR